MSDRSGEISLAVKTSLMRTSSQVQRDAYSSLCTAGVREALNFTPGHEIMQKRRSRYGGLIRLSCCSS